MSVLKECAGPAHPGIPRSPGLSEVASYGAFLRLRFGTVEPISSRRVRSNHLAPEALPAQIRVERGHAGSQAVHSPHICEIPETGWTPDQRSNGGSGSPDPTQKASQGA